MTYIYTPKGKAREYSPYALNIYIGCDHGCQYCYVPGIAKHKNIYPRVDPKKLDAEISKSRPDGRVLLCFMTDPYNHMDVETKLTRQTLKVLLQHDVQISVLTKGGRRSLRDHDLLCSFTDVQYGITAVFEDEAERALMEPSAAPTSERFEVLKTYHDTGIKTFVSFEPVYHPDQTLRMMEQYQDIIDLYKIGRLNHVKNTIDWRDFGDRAVILTRAMGKDAYFKDDLRAAISIPLTEKESTPFDDRHRTQAKTARRHVQKTLAQEEPDCGGTW